MAGLTKYFTDTPYEVVDGNIAYASNLNSPFTAIATGISTLSVDLQTSGSKYGADTGEVNAYVVSLDPAPTAYTEGLEVWLKTSSSNTGASTINVNSLGAVEIRRIGLEELIEGDIPANHLTMLKYSDGYFQLVVSSAASGAAEATTQATISTAQATISTAQATISTEQAAVAVEQAEVAAEQALIATTSNKAYTLDTRTTNNILGYADLNKIIDITSGTFTQTFDSVANIGDIWVVYIRNSGSGEITLQPYGSETIDGLSSFIMYPGEIRLIQCDGTKLTSLIIKGFSNTYLTSATFTKPPGYSQFSGEITGGGAGGWGSGGGGGGGTALFTIDASDIGATESVVIGSGEPEQTDGGDSTFSLATGVGGKSADGGGSGGGLATALASPDGFAGATATTNAVFGGGGGGYNSNGGDSVYGGGGGGGGYSKVGGTSAYAGNGGDSGEDGEVPGGGGGGGSIVDPGSGASGRLKLWGIV